MKIDQAAVDKRVADFLQRLENGQDDAAYQALVAIFTKDPREHEKKEFVLEYIKPALEQAVALAKALEQAGLIKNTGTIPQAEKALFSITNNGIDMVNKKQKELATKRRERKK